MRQAEQTSQERGRGGGGAEDDGINEDGRKGNGGAGATRRAREGMGYVKDRNGQCQAGGENSVSAVASADLQIIYLALMDRVGAQLGMIEDLAELVDLRP
eukprot:755135-Hanusia_phi.AAC.7